MKKDTPLQKLVCLLWVFSGAMVTGLGIVLVLQSGVGVDPLTMFEEGLAKTLGIANGSAVLMVNLSTLSLAFLLNRRCLGWGSLVCSLVIGPAVNLFTALKLPVPSGIWDGLAVNLLGIAVLGLGIALYMVPDYGVGGMEGIMIFLSQRTQHSYAAVRICMDSVCAVLGILLGGTFGLGLAAGVFGLGPAISLFYRMLRRAAGLSLASAG